MLRANGSLRGRSARVEGEGDRPGRPRLVLGTGEVPVEYPADRVSGQVFQDGIGDELVRSGRPGLAGHKLPGPFLGADLRRAADRLAVRPGHLQAAGEQAVIQRGRT